MGLTIPASAAKAIGVLEPFKSAWLVIWVGGN